MNSGPSQSETQPVCPPFRFAIVEENLYRGGYPTLKNFRFMQRLGLKTVISITPEQPTRDLAKFCSKQNIATHHFKVDKPGDNVVLNHSAVCQCLQIMTDAEKLPLYVHCLDGCTVTGLLVMCLRKLQGYDHIYAKNEFSRFTREGELLTSEEEVFVDSFKGEVELADNIVDWLWEGVRMQKHPLIKIKYKGGAQKDKVANEIAHDKERNKAMMMRQYAQDEMPVSQQPSVDEEEEELSENSEDEDIVTFDASMTISAMALEGVTRGSKGAHKHRPGHLIWYTRYAPATPAPPTATEPCCISATPNRKSY